jgi:hypothetical protein
VVHDQPVCAITGDSVVCYGFTTSFCATAGMASYAWSGPGGFSANTQCTGNIGTAGLYTVIITDANGCADTCGRTLVVHDQPVCAITGDSVVCYGFTTSFCATAGMASYAWSGPGGFSANTQCTGNIGTAGLYTVIITDANGCADTCGRTLVVNPNPTCSVSPADTTICAGTNATFCVNPSGGTPPYNYAWTGPNGYTKTDSCITVSDSGTYIVLVTDAQSCTTTCQGTLHTEVCGQEFCGLTQGYYGNAGGQYNGMGTLELIQSLLTPSPLVVGKPGRSLTIPLAAAQCIIDRLPANGPAAALPNFGDKTLNSGTCQTSPTPLPLMGNKPEFKNVLLGQTIALSLNLRLSACDLGTFELCSQINTQTALYGPDGISCTEDDVADPGPDGILGTLDDPVAVFTIPPSVLTALSNLGLSNTVTDLLELANRALAGQANLGGASLGDINNAVDAINRGFDKCRFVVYCGAQLFAPKEALGTEAEKALPSEFGSQSYPNPFNASATIAYALPTDGKVTIKVYNILGQKVVTLVDEQKPAGYHSVVWNGKDYQGNSVATGVYFYRVEFGKQTLVKKMALIK